MNKETEKTKKLIKNNIAKATAAWEALAIAIINEELKANREEKEITIDEALQDAERITNEENVWENKGRDDWETIAGYKVTPQELKLWKAGTTLTWYALIKGKSYMIK